MGRKDGKAVEKRRIRLEINGVVCWLITQESDEYMQSLAKEVGELLEEMQITSPYITRRPPPWPRPWATATTPGKTASGPAGSRSGWTSWR